MIWAEVFTYNLYRPRNGCSFYVSDRSGRCKIVDGGVQIVRVGVKSIKPLNGK